MISYDTYQNKIKRVAAVKNFIVRFRALFISLFAALIALAAAFVFTKGIITQDVVLPEKIVYGDDYAQSIQRPKALFSNANYEFARDNRSRQAEEVVWTDELPTLAGKYLVRTVTDKTFGKSYGEAKPFEIEALPVEFVVLSDSAVYGELPSKFEFSSVNGDRVVREGAIIDYVNPENEVTAIKGASFRIFDKSGNDVTFCYNVSIPEKEITLLPRSITLTPQSLSVTYDGNGVEYGGALEETSIAALNGDSATIFTRLYDAAGNAVEGAPVNAGSYSVRVDSDRTVIMNGTADVTKHYVVSYGAATVSVARRPVTFVTPSASKVYDGEPLVRDEITSANLVEGHTFTQSATAAPAADAGTYANGYECSIFASDGSCVDGNYDVSYDYGVLEIAKRPLTVTTRDLEKVYDGAALCGTAEDYSVEGELVDGHAHEIFSASSISGVAESGAKNAIRIFLYDADGRFVSQNYDIKYVYGIMTVMPREISITTASGSWVYDGADHCAPEIAEIGGAKLADGEEVTSITGTRVVYFSEVAVKNELTFTIHNGVNDVTANYAIGFIYGTLTIEKRPLVITTPSITKIYDGVWLYGTDGETVADNLAEFDKLKETDGIPRILDCGTLENAIEFTVDSGRTSSYYDVTDCYAIEYEYGNLEVLRRDITIRTQDANKYYDGIPLSGDSVTPIADNLVAGEECVPFETVTITDAGELTNTTHYKIFRTYDYPDVRDYGDETTANYNISYEYGKLTVEKRIVMVATATASREYDGTPFTCTDWEIIIIGDNEGSQSFGLLEDHTLAVDESAAPASVTGVAEGEVENRVSYLVKCGKDDVSANYTLAYIYGKISVTARNVLVVTGSGEWVYSAQDYSNPTAQTSHVLSDGWFEDGEKDFVLGHTLALSKLFTAQAAGTHPNECEYTVKNASGDDVSVNYNLIRQFGSLVIRPRPLVITTHDGNDVYDDEPFEYAYATPEEFDAAGERGICTGHVIECDRTQKVASVTYVTEGRVENELYFIVKDASGEPVTDNYKISYEYGEIYVTKRPVTLTTATSCKEFDGEPYCDQSYTITGGSLVDGHSVAVVDTVYVRFVTEGEVKNEVSYAIFKGPDENLTENYDISYEYGYVSVTVRYVEVRTASNHWIYDGDAHSDTSYRDEHLSDVWVDGDILTGTSDGTAGLVLGHKLVATKFTEVTDYTEVAVPNVVEYLVENEEIDQNYYLHIIAGELSINKRPVKIITPTAEKVYDGDPFSCTDGWKVEGVGLDVGLVKEHKLGVKLIGGVPVLVTSITDVKVLDGEVVGVENAVEYDVYDGQTVVSENYAIEYEYGTLKRTPRPITVTTGSKSQVYNGTALTCDEFDFEVCNAENTRGLLESKNHSVVLDESVPVAYIIYITRDGDREICETLNERKYLVKSYEKDESLNYAISYVYGTLTIEKRQLTVTTATLVWDYDGKLHYGTETQQSENGKTVFDNLVSVNGISEICTAEKTAEIIDYTEGGVVNDTQYAIYSVINSVETTYCYDITYHKGVLFINKVELNITTITAEKVYDGAYLYGDDSDYGEPVFVGIMDDEYRYEAFNVAKIIDCDSVDNSTEYAIYTPRGLSHNYIVSYSVGTLTVTQRGITVRTKDASHEYDGTEFTCTEWEDVGEFKLVEGHTLEVIEVKGRITDVGNTLNEVAYKVVDGSGSDKVNDNYTISYEYGTLTVTKRTIRVTTASNSWVYDGDGHFDDGYDKVVHIKDGVEDGAPALVLDHQLKPVEGTATVVVDYAEPVDNEVKFIVVDENVNANYSIEYVYGKLSIEQRRLTIATATSEREYDGTPFSWIKDFTVEQFNAASNRGIVAGHGAYPDAASAATVTYVHEGKVENVIAFVIENADGRDVTANYIPEYEYGTLSITPHVISVTNPTRNKDYDGEELRGNDEAIFDGLLLVDDVALADKTAVIIDFGEIQNNTVYRIENADGVNITTSYDIRYADGATLSINKIALSITTLTAQKVYDAIPLKGDDEQLSSPLFEGLIDGEYYRASAVTEIEDCGSVSNETKYRIFAVRGGAEADTTGNYIISYTYGTLTVTKRKIIIATASDTKEFDGTPLINIKDYQITSGSLAENQTLYVKEGAAISSVTFVTEGKVDNIIDYSVMGARGDVTANYDISYYNMFESTESVKKYGILEIIPRSISLTTVGNEWEYDGLEKYETGYTDLTHDGGGSALVLGHKLIAVSYDTVVTVGTVDNVVEYIVENEEITKNYAIGVSYGKLTVTPRKLSVVLSPVSDVIYGEAFEGWNGEFAYAAGSKRTVDGETLVITVKYTRGGVEVAQPVNAGIYGVEVNEASIVGGYADINNYQLTVLDSQFEIARREITINLLDMDEGRPYNGREFVYPDDGYEVAAGSIVDGDELKIAVKYLCFGVIISGYPVNVGDYTVTFDGAGCTVNGEKELALNYVINCGVNSVRYCITRLPLSLVLKDIQHAYTGVADYRLEDSDYMEFDESQLAETDVLSSVEKCYMLNGKVCDAIDVGVYDYFVKQFAVTNKDTGADVSDNYYLDNQYFAKFTITKRRISVAVSFEGEAAAKGEYTGEVISLKELYNGSVLYSSLPLVADECDWGIYEGDNQKLNAVFSFSKGGAAALLKELGEYTVSVRLEDNDGKTLSNYFIESYTDGAFEVTKRQVKVTAEMTATSLEYNGCALSEEYFGYNTKHVFSDSEGFVEESDYADYKAVYSLYRADGTEADATAIIAAGEYYLTVKLEFIGSGEEKYYVFDGLASSVFTVQRRKIYAVTPSDENEYVYNGAALADSETYGAYYTDGSAGFVNGDGEFAVPVFTYRKDGADYPSAVHAGEYSIRISHFSGVNGNIDLSANYELCDAPDESCYGTVTIKPAKLVVGPKAYSQFYDGTVNVLSLPEDSYNILFVEGGGTALFGNAELTFTASGSVDIRKQFMTMVSFKSVSVWQDGENITSDYDVVLTYAQLSEKCPELAESIKRDKFSAQLAFIRRTLYIRQFAPPEEYRSIEYGTNVSISLDDKSIPAENVLSDGDGLLAGHRPEISLARALGTALGYCEKWIYMCKVYDGNGVDLSRGYEIKIVCDDENSFIKVTPKNVTVSVNFPPSHYAEGDKLAAEDYNLSATCSFGDKLEVEVSGGAFVASVKSANGQSKDAYYVIKFVHPETEIYEKEVKYASRI